MWSTLYIFDYTISEQSFNNLSLKKIYVSLWQSLIAHASYWYRVHILLHSALNYKKYNFNTMIHMSSKMLDNIYKK